MNPVAHLNRIRAGISALPPTFASWILENTRLKGKPFSFLHHEYQKIILDDQHPRKVIKKCSQIGMSDLSLRYAMALCNVLVVKCSYVLPTTTFLQKFVKMRLDPLIDASPALKARLSKGNDSSQMKQFGESFFLGQGASASSAMTPLSLDLDCLIIDEIDACESQDLINQLISRLTHSEYKIETYFSTPTIPGYGISKKFEESKQFLLMQRCTRCNHQFTPDYFKHVVLPGFDRPLKDITYQTARLIQGLDLSTAYLQCPKCKRPLPSSYITDPSSRTFETDSPDSHSEFHGYHVTPFAVPKVIPPGDLIRRSTRYSAIQGFYNDGLGLDLDSSESGLSLNEIDTFFSDTPALDHIPPYSMLGMDMGGECATLIGYPTPNHSDVPSHLRVTHAELVPLHEVRGAYPRLSATHHVICGVIDSMPYTDVVLFLQGRHSTLWASVFSNKKGLSLYDIREKNEDAPTTAMSMVRGLDVARDRVLDLVVSSLRAGAIKFDPLPRYRSTITEHLLSLKRIRVKAMNGEETFRWVKTDGNDHFFFALTYLFLAQCVGGSNSCSVPLPFLAAKFKNTTL